MFRRHQRASTEEDALSTAQAAVLAHLRRFFAGHSVIVIEPPDPRVQERMPGFSIAAIAPGSSCDHLLVSLPYPFGRELEVCAREGGHARPL